MLQAAERQDTSEGSGRPLPAMLLALALLAATSANSADEPEILFEDAADAEAMLLTPARLEQRLARGDRIRIFVHSGTGYDLIFRTITGGSGSDLSGGYRATITGNTRTLRLRDSRVGVELQQSGSTLSGTFDRGRGKIWGDVVGDRILFEWFASGGSSGRGEWQVMPNGLDLRGSWYSNWQGDGQWNMRRSDYPAIDRSAVVVGEHEPDGARIEVPLDSIERIRLLAPATRSAGLEPDVRKRAESESPGVPNPRSGNTDDAPTDVDEAFPDLWTGVGPGETGVEIGALIFLGADFSVYHRPAGSPWMVGFRYLKTEDDFVSIDFDDSDKERITMAGPFARYLFSPGSNDSFYVGGGLYRMSQKVECRLGSDEDSATGLFVGGGFTSGANQPLGYNIGILLAPGLSLGTDTGDCTSDTDGGIDANASLVFRIR